MRAGRSPFAPDKAHLHHRLLEIGHSHRRAVLIMYFWSALLAFGAVAVSLSEGSMLLGLVLSGSALTLTGQFATVSVKQGGGEGWFVMLLPILLPISILIVPLADLVLAVVRRTRRGQAFYQPDKEHLHHRLLEIGHSQRRAVLIMWMWAGLVAFGAVLVALYSGPLTWTVIAAGLVLTVLLTFLLPRVQRPGEPRAEDRLIR